MIALLLIGLAAASEFPDEALRIPASAGFEGVDAEALQARNARRVEALRLKEAKSLRHLSHLREGLNRLCLGKVLELSSDPRELCREGCSPLLLQDPELRAFLIGLPLVALCLLPQELRGEDPARLGGIG